MVSSMWVVFLTSVEFSSTLVLGVPTSDVDGERERERGGGEEGGGGGGQDGSSFKESRIGLCRFLVSLCRQAVRSEHRD